MSPGLLTLSRRYRNASSLARWFNYSYCIHVYYIVVYYIHVHTYHRYIYYVHCVQLHNYIIIHVHNYTNHIHVYVVTLIMCSIETVSLPVTIIYLCNALSRINVHLQDCRQSLVKGGLYVGVREKKKQTLLCMTFR